MTDLNTQAQAMAEGCLPCTCLDPDGTSCAAANIPAVTAKFLELLTENARLQAELAKHQPRPESEWHEDFGPALWWKFPLSEAPYCGSPLDCGHAVGLQIIGASEPFLNTQFQVGGWPGYHTHWTPIPWPPQPPQASKGGE